MFQTTLIAVDVSDAAGTQHLLRAAKALTVSWTGALHVITVVPNAGMPIVASYMPGDFDDTSRKAAAELLQTALQEAQIDAQPHVTSGKAYDSVISKAEELGAGLILVGAHQPELRDYLLGSNAARIVRHSSASVAECLSGR